MSVIVGQTLWHRFPLGKPEPDGGNTICRTGGGVAWIVAPESSEVSRNWNGRNDAVTTATNCTSATGWFVPTCDQLYNPGYCCRTYWDSCSSAGYWSSTVHAGTLNRRAWGVNFGTGITGSYSIENSLCVRAFRCVTY